MDEELLHQARRFDRNAVEATLSEFYPLVTRLTLALTGRLDVGSGVAKYVMRRSLHVLPKWQHAGDPLRWYTHHAIISTRRANARKAYLGADTLGGPKPQPKYMAFVVAVRDLPYQQREALILQDCEGLDLRQTAVAMDCSTEAAANHLDAARQQLRLIAGPDYDRLATALKRTYANLTPPEELRLPAVRRYVSRHVWPRRIKKILILLILLGLLAAVYWALSRFGLLPERFRIAR